MSTRRIIVERPIAEEFTARLAEKTKGLKTGDPHEHDTIIGPLINGEALELVKARVEDAVAQGAKLLAGGEAVGPCYQATLLSDVPADSEFARTRPSGRSRRSRSSTAPTRRSNARTRRRTGSARGSSPADADRGFQLAQRIQSGIVHVNDQSVGDEPQMPFGGVKDSGFGRFGGHAVVDEFTDVHWVTLSGGTSLPVLAWRRRHMAEIVTERCGEGPRPRRGPRRARGLHASDPERRRARGRPPGAARPDAACG